MTEEAQNIEESQNLEVEISEITDEKIEKAALPKNRRVEEVVQDNAVEIDVDQDVSAVSQDEVKEDFAVSPRVEEKAKDQSEVEKRATLAQNRINKAVAQAKEFQRRELMAIQYANDLKDQNQKLRQSQKSFQTSYGDEFGSRVESQLSLSKQALRQATDAGDSEAIATATEALSMATTDKARHEQYISQQKQYEAQEQAYVEQAQQQQAYQQSQPAQEEYNEPSNKARTWANKNTWFGKDQVATSVAFAVHKQLENEGFDTESDEYYTEINKRVQQELPQRFNVEADKKPVQQVASATRNTSTGRKQNRIELTPSEQQLAKKLGVSFKDYAIQKARLQKS
jgi:hypothetical protein|tara:strand:+ start:490 stop:1512 length:1023 start_codon:yes stop_codon:yes gene_type:complete